MKVLSVITSVHEGGAEAHLLLLARGLQAQGVTCGVAFLRSAVAGGSVDLREHFERAGIRTYYLACESPYDPRSGSRLNRLLADGSWDVLHSHLPRADAAAAACKLLNRRLPWISTLHHPYDSSDRAYSAARLVPLMAPMWRLADGVIAVSEAVRQWSIGRLGVSADAVRTIVHGITSHGRGAAPVTDPARCCIGSIGRYEERKGHETLIRSMVPIVRRFPNAQLRIAGHDPWGHGDVLRRLIRELGLEDHVHLVGFVSDKETFFAGIDVFAFASRSEGFGIVLLEAMDAGKPSVVSDISPLKDIICPGHSGLVAERQDPDAFAQAIIALFEDRARLRCMGDAARQRVASEFSQGRMVERTLDFYRAVHARVAR